MLDKYLISRYTIRVITHGPQFQQDRTSVCGTEVGVLTPVVRPKIVDKCILRCYNVNIIRQQRGDNENTTQEIIRQLEADNSRLAKEAVIQSAMEEGLDEFFEGVKMALDPLVTFGVKQVPEKEENEVLAPQGLLGPYI